ncbi:sensor histidine kinase [Rhizobacter sp. P5_C2]
MRSIERYLLAWLMGALALGGLLVAIVTYVVTLDEMNEVFDADLKNVAQSVARYHLAAYDARRHDALVLPERTDTPDDVEIVTLTWTDEGERVYASDPRVKLPFSNIEGLARLEVDGEEWIVYSSVAPDGVAQAAQRVSQRHQMAAESGAKVFPPMLVLVIVVGGLLLFGLRRGLQPLGDAARDVAARSARSMLPIATDGVPREIKPLVLSINDLLGRLSESFAAQRRFLADAAHELRTPVTALRLQVHLLRRSDSPTSRQDALDELEQGVIRSERMVQQLLAVARSEPDGESMRVEQVSLDDLVRSAVSDFAAKAEHRGIDLGARVGAGIMARADAHQLRVLLDNLVENALRYTPSRGVVDVEADLQDGRPRLRVVDNGPGIPEAERERVFDRFYRGVDAQTLAPDSGGSGLGLAIVQAIAERQHANVSLHTPQAHRGLEVRVVFSQLQGA